MMNTVFRRLAIAAAATLAAPAWALSTLVVGTTTSFLEDFNGGPGNVNTFVGGTVLPALLNPGDSYLALSILTGSPASATFSIANPIQTLSFQFKYVGLFTGTSVDGTFSVTGPGGALTSGNLSNNSLLLNPGPNGATFTSANFSHLLAGDYTFTFARNTGNVGNALNIDDFQLTVTTEPVVVPIPEPSTYALMALGLGVVGWTARRRRAQGSPAWMPAGQPALA